MFHSTLQSAWQSTRCSSRLKASTLELLLGLWCHLFRFASIHQPTHFFRLMSTLLPASLLLSMLRCQSTRLVNRSDLMPSNSRSRDDDEASRRCSSSAGNALLSFLLPIQPSFLVAVLLGIVLAPILTACPCRPRYRHTLVDVALLVL